MGAALGAQDVFHLHRLDHHEGGPGGDLLTHPDRDVEHGARHGAAHRAVGGGLGEDARGEQVVCHAGATLYGLERLLDPMGRDPHSVIGSSCLGASVVGGVCNNSGGALVDMGIYPLTLAHLLEEMPEARFNIDVKDEASVAALPELLERWIERV